MRNSLLAAGILVSVLATSACDDDDNPPVGTLQQGWTIAGDRTAAACSRVGATQLRLVIFDPGLFVEATRFVPCTDFTASLPLVADTYTGTATFLDASGAQVSTVRSITPFIIGKDITTIQNVDFPLSDFLR